VSLDIAVVSSLVVKGKQNVLWSDESERWSERRLFLNHAQHHERGEEFDERSVTEGIRLKFFSNVLRG